MLRLYEIYTQLSTYIYQIHSFLLNISEPKKDDVCEYPYTNSRVFQPLGSNDRAAPSPLPRHYIRNPTEEISQILEIIQMKNIALLSILGMALLQPAVEAFFLGPIAVGAVIGALAVGKGFLLGSVLSQRRSRKQSYRLIFS